jgi:4-alpha-glucanotransferase
VGTLGREARAFVDFLNAAGVGVWQVLPLGPTGSQGSPYMARSAFGGNPLLLDLRSFVEQGWLEESDLLPLLALPRTQVNWEALTPLKLRLLEQAYSNFLEHGSSTARARFEAFRAREAAWLDEHALFEALSAHYEGKAWWEWRPEHRSRQPGALEQAREKLAFGVGVEAFAQWQFAEQWGALRQYANDRGVKLLGDLPIFVSHDSSDVWASPSLFHLDGEGKCITVAGVPPDYFAKDGQLWGNPLYRWDELERTGYAWWIRRLSAQLRQCDRVRIDHFRGFAQYWEVPAGAKTAKSGRWVDGPGRKLFDALRSALGGLPLLAEDLGIITPDVEALRREVGLPGMAVLQFAFGGKHSNAYLPHNYADANRVVYTGTHDNDTTAGWYAQAGAQVAHHARVYLQTDGSDIAWRMIRLAWSSVAELAVAPVQDVLGLGSAARMNTPGEKDGNWAWRLAGGALGPAHASKLRDLAELYNRVPKLPEEDADPVE